MSGFAQIPAGSRGLCLNTFDFTGIQGQSSYSLALKGEIEGPFTLKADPDVVSWSPCGGTTAIMNMNTACNISPTKQDALIAVCLAISRAICVDFQDSCADRMSGSVRQIRSIASAARSPSTSRSTGASARKRDGDDRGREGVGWEPGRLGTAIRRIGCAMYGWVDL